MPDFVPIVFLLWTSWHVTKHAKRRSFGRHHLGVCSGSIDAPVDLLLPIPEQQFEGLASIPWHPEAVLAARLARIVANRGATRKQARRAHAGQHRLSPLSRLRVTFPSHS